MLCIKNGCQLATDAGRSFLRPLIYFRSEITPLRVPMSYLSSRPISRWFITFSNRVYDWWILYERIIKFFFTRSAGDRILSVNGLDCDELDYDQVIDQMRRIPRDVELLVLHRPDGANVSSAWRPSSSLENRIRPWNILQKTIQMSACVKTTNGPFPYRRVCDNQTESRGMGPVFCSRPL